MWYWRIIYVAEGVVNTVLSTLGYPTPQDATKNLEDNWDDVLQHLYIVGAEDIIEVTCIFIALSGDNGHVH